MAKKRNKTKRYSYINVISSLLDKYYTIYSTLSEHREECVSAEFFNKINTLLVEDYNNSINNLEYLSKKGMKFLKKKTRNENKKIIKYRIKRFFHLCKVNEEIELLIKKREKYNLELGYLFEDLVSSNIRTLVNSLDEVVEDEEVEDEPDYCTEGSQVITGPEEHRSLTGEVIDSQSLTYNKE